MIRKLVKRLFKLHDIKELQAGGHCGLCGRWIEDEVFEKKWAVGVCKECK